MYKFNIINLLAACFCALSSIGSAWAGADWMVVGNQIQANFGHSVAGVGDVNGDGYDDVMVGICWTKSNPPNRGRANLYLGSAAGLAASPAWSIGGDQDDVLFGSCVAGAGDVNGDGYDDVIINAPNYSNGQSEEGRVYLYLGSAAGLAASPAWVKEGDQAQAHFGWSVAGAGDVNGDGFADVIIGADGYPGGGRAWVYLGSATGLSANPIWTANGVEFSSGFGRAVAGAGDVNGDGYDDILVGQRDDANGKTNAGRAYLFLGSATGPASTPAWIIEGDQEYALLGDCVAGAGDVNGDGYDDVLVGTPHYTSNVFWEGRVCLYLGSASGLNSVPAWTKDGNQNDRFGQSMACIGDMNGDGKSDVLIGAPAGNEGAPMENKFAYLFLGTVTGLTAAPVWTAAQVGSNFGYSVAGAGDVNHDGKPDLIVGDPSYSSAMFAEGAAFLYLGSGSVPVELSRFSVE